MSFLSFSKSGRSHIFTRKMGAIMDSAAPRASQFRFLLSLAISMRFSRCAEIVSSSGFSPRPGRGLGRPCACRRMASTSLRAWWEALRERMGAFRHWKSGRLAAMRVGIMVGAFSVVLVCRPQSMCGVSLDGNCK